jgi:hypothetical protein
MNQKPFDFGLLNQPTQILIQFNPLSTIFKGAGAYNLASIMQNRAEAIEVVGSFGDFLDPRDSLKTLMLREPSFVYNSFMNVPFGAYDSGRLVGPAAGYDSLTQPASTLSVNVVPPSGNTVAIYMALVKEGDYIPSSSSGACANFLRTYEMRDVTVSHNGRVYMRSPGRSSRYEGLLQTTDQNAYPVNTVVWNSSTSTYQDGPAYYNPITVLNLAIEPVAVVNSDVMMAGVNFASAPLQIQFTAPTITNQANGDPDYYHLYYIFIYNSAYQISNGGATVEFRL